jgi:hypothetical protein
MFSVVAELDCIFHIDVDESWRRGAMESLCDGHVLMGSHMEGVMYGFVVASSARLAKFIRILTFEIARRFDGGCGFCGVCKTCLLRVWLTGCTLSFHLECVYGYAIVPGPVEFVCVEWWLRIL